MKPTPSQKRTLLSITDRNQPDAVSIPHHINHSIIVTLTKELGEYATHLEHYTVGKRGSIIKKEVEMFYK